MEWCESAQQMPLLLPDFFLTINLPVREEISTDCGLTLSAHRMCTGCIVGINRGSEWRQWEPHIHAPGTVLNNQFGGGDAWTNYLSALENATPKIEQIITSLTHTKRCFGNVLPDAFPMFAYLPEYRGQARRGGEIGVREPPPNHCLP